eukprot:scaffold141426_cov33-Tisochrysis_lutea.AAC.3
MAGMGGSGCLEMSRPRSHPTRLSRHSGPENSKDSCFVGGLREARASGSSSILPAQSASSRMPQLSPQ